MLTNYLSHFRNSSHDIRDAFDFVRKIQQSTRTNKLMTPFDATSLYTDVSLTLTMNYNFNQMYRAS
jgi:hypothetical protein